VTLCVSLFLTVEGRARVPRHQVRSAFCGYESRPLSLHCQTDGTGVHQGSIRSRNLQAIRARRSSGRCAPSPSAAAATTRDKHECNCAKSSE